MADEEIRQLLTDWGLEDVIRQFEENGIDKAAFKLLDKTVIQELIPKIGSRLKFISKFKEYHAGAQSEHVGMNQARPQPEHVDAVADQDGDCDACLNLEGRMVQVPKEESFEYVPLHELFRIYLQQPGMMTSILENCYTDVETHDELTVLSSYCDGTFYRDGFCEEGRLVLPILLYCDDFETTNPLGSRKGLHKLCAFYMSFLCIPRKHQSRLSNILLVALAKSIDVTKYSIDTVLGVIVKDLQNIYSEGIAINSPGEYVGLVHPKLFQVTGDNLGLHSMLGFACGFTANFPCRICKYHRIDCQKQEEENINMIRPRQNFTQDVEIDDLSETGVARSSILNELSYYHVVENLALDYMHDLLEGVVPMEVKMVLKALIDLHMFSLLELNSRISSFSYGFTEKQNCPTQYTMHGLSNPKGSSGQKAAQMQCLLLNLPLIIGDKVDENSDYCELILILIDIYKLITAPSISLKATFMLKAIIKDHHCMFKELFPAMTLTPKHHHLAHYPRAIRLLGPLSQYSAMRFEGKHKTLKCFAKNANNFLRIDKTVARMHQIAQSHEFLVKQDVDGRDIEVHSQAVVPVTMLKNGVEVIEILGCPNDSDVITANIVKISGYKFKPSTAVLLRWSELPEFGEIQDILIVDSVIKFIVKPWKTSYFEKHYHAYSVETNTEAAVTITAAQDLCDHRPVHAVKSFDEGDSNFYVAVLPTTPCAEKRRRIHFDIRGIISKYARGGITLSAIQKNRAVNPGERKVIVHALVTHLIDTYGENPHSTVKEVLAENLIEEFPCLKDPMGPTGHEAWFIKGMKGRPATGYLEARLRYVRMNLNRVSQEDKTGGKQKQQKPEKQEQHNKKEDFISGLGKAKVAIIVLVQEVEITLPYFPMSNGHGTSKQMTLAFVYRCL
ncbi:hypothetical protein HOLleu_18274 [Holothuria leucospilota]|uniref:Uncharacterized protein n=1 Tax=Holothuria leucospilota TaxID=206669 RepID=A0A9Q1C3E5_HOLLE|nr:hypothetical protein HOLleu_18274 [Holothuria leucospilota]